MEKENLSRPKTSVTLPKLFWKATKTESGEKTEDDENGHAVRLARNLRSGSGDGDGVDRLLCRPAYHCRPQSGAAVRLHRRSGQLRERSCLRPDQRRHLRGVSALFFLNHRAVPGYDASDLLRMGLLAATAVGTAMITGMLRQKWIDAFAWEQKHHGTAMRLSAALDQVDIGIVLLDSDTRAEFINRAFRDYFSLSDEQARLQAAVHRADVPRPRYRRLGAAGGRIERLHRQANRNDARRRTRRRSTSTSPTDRCCAFPARRCPMAGAC